MVKKNIAKHAVTFNMNDPEQKAMYNYIAQFPNVSGKLKRLIWSDMNGIVPVKQEPIQKETVIEKEIESVAIDNMF